MALKHALESSVPWNMLLSAQNSATPPPRQVSAWPSTATVGDSREISLVDPNCHPTAWAARHPSAADAPLPTPVLLIPRQFQAGPETSDAKTDSMCQAILARTCFEKT